MVVESGPFGLGVKGNANKIIALVVGAKGGNTISRLSHIAGFSAHNINTVGLVALYILKECATTFGCTLLFSKAYYKKAGDYPC